MQEGVWAAALKGNDLVAIEAPGSGALAPCLRAFISVRTVALSVLHEQW